MVRSDLEVVLNSWLKDYSLCCNDIFKKLSTVNCSAADYRNLVVGVLYNEFGLPSSVIAELLGMHQSNISVYIRLGNEYIYLNDWYCKYVSLYNHIVETL